MDTVATTLRSRAYRSLFAAQVVALLGTGLLTVALSLLAYDIAPGSAGAVVSASSDRGMVQAGRRGAGRSCTERCTGRCVRQLV